MTFSVLHSLCAGGGQLECSTKMRAMFCLWAVDIYPLCVADVQVQFVCLAKGTRAEPAWGHSQDHRIHPSVCPIVGWRWPTINCWTYAVLEIAILSALDLCSYSFQLCDYALHSHSYVSPTEVTAFRILFSKAGYSLMLIMFKEMFVSRLCFVNAFAMFAWLCTHRI